MENSNNNQSVTYFNEATKNTLIKLFEDRSRVSRIYAAILIIALYILYILYLGFIIYENICSVKPVLSIQTSYINLSIMLALLTGIIILTKIVLSIYQSFMSMARFYDSRADALKILGSNFNISDFEKICNLLTLPYYIWGRKVDIKANMFPEFNANNSK